MSKKFEIRSYGCRELAGYYRPHIQQKNAWNTMKNWIEKNQKLHKELLETGYDPDSIHTFTPRQVEIIVRHIGYP